MALGALVDGSKIGHHLHELEVVDLSGVPLHAIGRLEQVPADLTLGHAADELLPRSLPRGAELNAGFGRVVEELVVLNPESHVPGLVVGPAVVGRGHLSGVDHIAILGPQRRICSAV